MSKANKIQLKKNLNYFDNKGTQKRREKITKVILEQNFCKKYNKFAKIIQIIQKQLGKLRLSKIKICCTKNAKKLKYMTVFKDKKCDKCMLNFAKKIRLKLRQKL